MKIRGLFIALAIGAMPIGAVADIGRVENYLVGDEGVALADEISQLRSQVRQERLDRSKAADTIRDLIGFCPVSDEPLSRDTLLLWASDLPEERAEFYAALGEHLGLPEAFEPDNMYHHEVFKARAVIVNLHERGEFSEDEITDIANAALGYMSDYHKMVDGFWPQELGSAHGVITQDDLYSIRFSGRPDSVIAEVISNILMDRAALTRDMLEDKLNVCGADDEDDLRAGERARRYLKGFKPQG